jgi:hypothetical protein
MNDLCEDEAKEVIAALDAYHKGTAGPNKDALAKAVQTACKKAINEIEE